MDREITFATLAGGAGEERFQLELERVLENIQDVNTDETKVREIILKVRIKPNRERTIGDVTISAESKLSSVRSVSTLFHMGTQKGKATAVEYDPKQGLLFDKDQAPPAPRPVAGPFATRGDGGSKSE